MYIQTTKFDKNLLADWEVSAEIYCWQPFPYSTDRSQHNIDFAKMNQNKVMQIRPNFFEDF